MVRKNNLSRTINYQKLKCISGNFSFIKKCGWNMVLLIILKQLAKLIHSLFNDVSYHTFTHYRKIECSEQFRKFKFCKKHISCSTTPLLIQGHTEVVFLPNIGNFTSRRRIFGLRFFISYFGIFVFL